MLPVGHAKFSARGVESRVSNLNLEGVRVAREKVDLVMGGFRLPKRRVLLHPIAHETCLCRAISALGMRLYLSTCVMIYREGFGETVDRGALLPSRPIQMKNLTIVFVFALHCSHNFSFGYYVNSGSPVMTPMGRGTVKRYKKRSRCFVINLDWKMSNGKPVKAYLQPNYITVLEVRTRHWPMWSSGFLRGTVDRCTKGLHVCISSAQVVVW